MMNTTSTSNDSNTVKFLLHFPIQSCLFLYLLTIPFNEVVSETFLWIYSITALIYIVIHFFSKDRSWHLFRLGGEGFLFLFLVSIFSGWWLNETFSLQNVYSLRWFLFLYVTTYIFDIFPGLNTRVLILTLAGAACALFGIFQTSIEPFALSGLVSNPSFSVWPEISKYSAQAFFENREVFGVCISMLCSFPLACLIFQKRTGKRVRISATLLCLLMVSAVVLSQSSLAWGTLLGALAALSLMDKKMVRAIVLAMAIFLLPSFVQQTTTPEVADKINQTTTNSIELRRDLLRDSINRFKENPWLGDGFQNYKKSGTYEPAPNTYFQLLSSTGLIGFCFFMLFAVSYLFMVLQLWREIPPAHSWHRVILAGSFAGQVTFHLTGLHLWAWDQFALVNIYILSLAIVAYLNERYSRGIVSDDYSL